MMIVFITRYRRMIFALGALSIGFLLNCYVDAKLFAVESPSPVVEAGLDMRVWIEQCRADEASLQRRYRIPLSAERMEKLRAFYASRLKELNAIRFSDLSRDSQVDFILIKNYLRRNASRLEHDHKRDVEASVYLPYTHAIVKLAESRENIDPLSGREAANRLDQLAKAIQAEIDREQAAAKGRKEPLSDSERIVALRAAENVSRLKRTLQSWHGFYDGYDPEFTWWTKEPIKVALQRLDEQLKLLRQSFVGVPLEDNTTIIGEPIGKESLLEELEYEMIPYSPEELVAIANEQFAWCDREMEKASRGLGFDDWRQAQEHVKNLHVEAGAQPALIRKLAWEAIDFVESRDLLTIPDLAKVDWRMEMMSPEAQRMNPFFLGGESIIVSYPTDSMTHEEKLMSMRGNNEHFSRATVHHELIPGHHLQMFMNARYRPYREIFSTPFWIEGWALYWEMLLWDLNFPRNNEDRIGMLFWRKHRCARIIFSLNYQLGTWTADECVKFLIDRVGHEPANAQAEVRRSVMGGYGPLYQAGYMLGGLQIRALHHQLVDSRQMSHRDFHDEILKQNNMPIELLRAILTNQELAPDFHTTWRFNDKTN